MKIKDRVYGIAEIKDSVLIELINSKPVQRLKGINQAGASQYAIKGKTVTRYEHSVGVMILLKKLGASVEEQIAGLLHDVPHTAFSHVIDFVFKKNNPDQEFHERFHEKIIRQSEIPKILKKYDFKINMILDENNFGLLEKKLPDLCADRIDYTLRDMTAREGFSDKINEYISNFIVHDGEIIIKNKETAKKFAEDYMKIDEEIWSFPKEIALFQILADAVKIALDEKILNEDDLFKDDLYVYSKLKKSQNKRILKKLDMLNPNLKIIDDPNNYDFYTKNKLRYVDPKFLDSDKSTTKVSEKFSEFSTKISEHIKLIQRGHFIRIVSF
ncbi:MAG: HD domain-containing protein [Candidatus Aenigmarchaeota archaeon]|nr:HD domain-containing protein [Candidatus Aenigmarchaeota archaeon]